MLDLRPNCECCDKDLPNGAPDAMICTFECTFCTDCARTRWAAIAPIAAAISSSGRPGRSRCCRNPASTKRVRKDHEACRQVAWTAA